MDNSTSKFTRKFVIKFIIWFLLFTIISTIGVVMAFAVSIEGIDENDAEEVIGAFNGLMGGLLVSDLVVAFLATKLSLKGVFKKVEITSENKGTIARNIVIVLVIFAVLVCWLHSTMRTTIFDLVNSDSDFDIEEFEEEYEEYGDDLEEFLEDEGYEEYGISEEEAELVEGLLKFWKMTNLYIFDGLFLLIMIPVAKKAIDKKVA